MNSDLRMGTKPHTGLLKVPLLCVVKRLSLYDTFPVFCFQIWSITMKKKGHFSRLWSSPRNCFISYTAPKCVQEPLKMQAHLPFGFPQFFRFIIIFYFASGLISYPSLYLPFIHKSPPFNRRRCQGQSKYKCLPHNKSISHMETEHRKTEKLTFVSSLRIFSLGRISRTFWSGSPGQVPNLMSISLC